MNKNIEKLKCTDLKYHSLSDIKLTTKCKWCSKTVLQIIKRE